MQFSKFTTAILSLIIASSISYDSTIQFHPNGRLLQLERSKEAVSRGSPVLAIKCVDGVIVMIVQEKRATKLQIYKSHKLSFVDDHICIAATGLLSDALVVVDLAKKISIKYRCQYHEPIPIEKLTSDLSSMMHTVTRTGSSRPIGVGLIIAGIDDHLGPQIFRTDPEGSYDAWLALCLGQESESLMNSLQASKAELAKITVTKSIEVIQTILSKHFRIANETPIGKVPLSDSGEGYRNDYLPTSDKEWNVEVCCGMLSSDQEVTWSHIKIDTVKGKILPSKEKAG